METKNKPTNSIKNHKQKAHTLMIVIVLSILLFLIFTVLGGFHFYWLMGGTWGLEQAIPSIGDKANSLEIPPLATLTVGVALVLFGLSYLIKAGLLVMHLPSWFTDYAYWFIPVVFILRAIGEFKYAGFFKKIKNTVFAKADTKIFSPLCLGIGIAGIIIQVM